MLKKNDEYKYKKDKVNENIDNPSSLWGTVKNFMDWKKTGTPSQIVKNNILYKKAEQVAKIMNEYFVEKIRNLKLKFGDIPVAFEHCHKAMLGKKCKLSMKFVTQKKVLKILKNLKNSRSLAIDELDSYSLKITTRLRKVGTAHHYLQPC